MNAAELLSAITGDGLTLALDGAGGIRCRGDRAKVNHHLPAIRAHKPELVLLLTGGASSSVNDPTSHTTTLEPTEPAPYLPPPWDAIRDRIQAGWRAEFAAPGADGRQAITWIQPGAWEPSELRRNETTPTARPLAEAGMVRCGDCRNWTPPAGDGAGRCGQGVKPTLAQGPLCRSTPRYCVAFDPITSTRRRRA